MQYYWTFGVCSPKSVPEFLFRQLLSVHRKVLRVQPDVRCAPNASLGSPFRLDRGSAHSSVRSGVLLPLSVSPAYLAALALDPLGALRVSEPDDLAAR